MVLWQNSIHPAQRLGGSSTRSRRYWVRLEERWISPATWAGRRRSGVWRRSAGKRPTGGCRTGSGGHCALPPAKFLFGGLRQSGRVYCRRFLRATAAVRSCYALPCGGYPQSGGAFRRAGDRGWHQPGLRGARERMRNSVHGAGVFVERGGCACWCAWLPDSLAPWARTTARLDAQLGRPHQVQRRHRTGRRRRSDQRICQQYDRPGAGHQWLFRPCKRSYRASVLSHHAMPDRGYP